MVIVSVCFMRKWLLRETRRSARTVDRERFVRARYGIVTTGGNCGYSRDKAKLSLAIGWTQSR